MDRLEQFRDWTLERPVRAVIGGWLVVLLLASVVGVVITRAFYR